MKDYNKTIKLNKNIAFGIHIFYALYISIVIVIEVTYWIYLLLILIPSHLCFYLYNHFLFKQYKAIHNHNMIGLEEMEKKADHIGHLMECADKNDSYIFKENVMLKKERIDLLQTIEKLERKNISLN